MAVAPQQTEEAAPALPLGRRSPRGTLRWYLVACPEGREATTCAKLRGILPAELLVDAFVPRVEHVRKYHGAWATDTRSLFKGYLVVTTADAPALARALARLSFPVRLVGAVGRGYAPVDSDAQAFLGACMDATHTIRSSEGEIVADELHVLVGPLKGHESRVSRLNRGKCTAWVRMGGGAGAFTLPLPLTVPVRR